MSEKPWPNLYSNLLYKMGQDFLDTVDISVSDQETFHFKLPDPFQWNGSGSGLIKNQPIIIEKLTYNKNLIIFLQKYNILIKEHYKIITIIFLVIKRKKVKLNLVFFLFKVWSGSVFPQNGFQDPNPYQNKTDPKHW